MTERNSILKNFNIENLFSSNESKPYTNGKLDINTLFKNNLQDSNFVFDSDTLLNGVRKRKVKLEDTHIDIFKGCCRTITSANDTGITDIFYEVPENIIECIDYDPKICMKFIKEKLNEHNISSLIIKKSRTKMFITWKDLEKKLAEKEENEKTNNINTMSAFESRT